MSERALNILFYLGLILSAGAIIGSWIYQFILNRELNFLGNAIIIGFSVVGVFMSFISFIIPTKYSR